MASQLPACTRHSHIRPILGILILGFMVFIAGCTSIINDAPSDLVRLGNSWGVATLSVQPPYRVVSESFLSRSRSTGRFLTRTALLRKSRLVARGCFKRWCWSVRGTPTVETAWKTWLNQRRAQCPPDPRRPCVPQLGWGAAFKVLYATATTLLGHPPLPAHVHLLLLPDGTGYHNHVELRSETHVPLELAFHFPVDQRAPGFPLHVKKTLVSIAGTVFYEFQHIEYAAGGTLGPKVPETARVVKNEANSECWRLSADVILDHMMGHHLYIVRTSRSVRRLTMALSGGAPRFSNAALYGPMLLKQRLERVLLERDPGLKDGSYLDIAPANSGARKALLAYCVHFSRDSRNILVDSVPTNSPGIHRTGHVQR